jgi:hypothetical protein
LKKEFAMKDLGPLTFFLGFHVHHTSDGLHLSQSKYISELLDPANMLGAKPSKTPLSTGAKLSQLDGDPYQMQLNVEKLWELFNTVH